MVEKVNFSAVPQNVQFKANSAKVSDPQVNFCANESKNGLYVDKETAEAIKNYMTNPLNMNGPVALNDYKDMLVKSGLVEGKDFEIKNFENRLTHKVSHVIRISQKDDPEKIRKVVFWKDGDGVENYDGCADTYYLANGGDRESFTVHRDSKGRTTEQSTVYKNPDNHKNLFPENIDLNTKPEDYMKLLDEKNIKYEVKNFDSKNGVVIVQEYAADGKTPSKMTVFGDVPGCKSVDQVVFDENGKFMHATNLEKNDAKGGEYKLYVTQSIDEINEAAKKISMK